LLEPTKGKLKVDGTEINKFNKKSWQKNIAIVPQYIFLDDSSISQNIAIGIPKDQIDFNKVKLVAQKAQISNFIEKLPNKYEEKVGERGFKLSGGQRQRIGVARALYRNSKLIIFDEPTNTLDSDTEELVLKSISNLENNITVILITHSKNTLKFCDQVIDLSNQKKI
jgi:ATP-binding cassette subfamily B protein